MGAAAMSLELHERGIHAVWSGAGEASVTEVPSGACRGRWRGASCRAGPSSCPTIGCVQPDDRLERVRTLREKGRNPKEIARILDVRPAEASQLVRAAAALAQDDAPEPALVGCWVSPGWSTGLAIGDHPGWPLDDDPDGGSQGLISVLVARRGGRYGKVAACGYLADVYCLGV